MGNRGLRQEGLITQLFTVDGSRSKSAKDAMQYTDKLEDAMMGVCCGMYSNRNNLSFLELSEFNFSFSMFVYLG